MQVIHTSPRILNDDWYTYFNGWTGTSTPAQRDSAYMISEYLVERHLQTFLIHTTITGTFPVTGNSVLVLPHTRVVDVGPVTILREPVAGNTEDYVRRNAFGRAVDLDRGMIRVWESSSQSGCLYTPGALAQVEVPYTAGFTPNEITGSHLAMHALCIIAEEALEQIVDPAASEGGPGAPGVTEYSIGGYSETRVRIPTTGLGTTPRAALAAKLLKPFKIRVGGRLGQ